MENTEAIIPFNFKRFFFRSWLFNLVISFVFGILLLWMINGYTGFTANRTTFLTNIACLILSWTHGLLLLLFGIRRLSKTNYKAGFIFLIQGIFTFFLSYYFYTYLAIFGWTCAMKG
jgi:hypothetical protein